ncbi:MAG: hypothetical protein ACR2QX_11110 [Woeseiaceae bacterium]
MSTDAKKGAESATLERVSRRVECLGPEDNVRMPDIYTDEDAANENMSNEPEHEPRDEQPPDFDTSEGFNPYDTGSLFRK